MIARGLALLAGLKARQPDRITHTNREHLARAVEARRREPSEAERIAARLRGLGYQVAYGYDADLGDWAEARVEGRVVARAARCGSVEACLREVAGELGVEV